MHVAIFTSHSADPGSFVSQAIQTADTIIAADCGAMSALQMGITPTAVVGDFDSLDGDTLEFLKKKQVTFIETPIEKDETDAELAIAYAIEQGATKISFIGGIAGDRIEHTIANISLTYHPSVPIYLVNGVSKSWIVLGSQEVSIDGEKNDLLSLLPLSQVVTGIKTAGLCYPLLNEPLYFGKSRGLSNVFAEKTVSVSFEEGMLLFVHTNPNELSLTIPGQG